VVLKVGGTTPLWAILKGKGVKKNKGGDMEAKQDKGGENIQPLPLIDH